MNSKLYLPIACLLFCVSYIVVADAPPESKLLITGAAAVFALMMGRALRSGKNKKK